eukprot:CAMPEP_0184858122 /NCGR_PEP_ID=MMETSP0580-20130426/3240_1 /TAXON_ID=1118495 /ORGANISM="Dactyliosolen fragilissimus" /LENGTH=54 /DNA_ID=CAMNT_0027354087 /DNA_START=1 /DNA_END=162 /DNA_ORIENTATION=-
MTFGGLEIDGDDNEVLHVLGGTASTLPKELDNDSKDVVVDDDDDTIDNDEEEEY